MTAQECASLNEIWYARVQEFRTSGLSGPQWCGARGLKVKQLHYWNRKFREVDADASKTTWLVAKPPLVTVPPDALEVRVGPATITVPPAFDPDVLQRIVQVLASC